MEISDPLNIHCLIGIQIPFRTNISYSCGGNRTVKYWIPQSDVRFTCQHSLPRFRSDAIRNACRDIHIRGHSGNSVDNPWNAMAVPWAFFIHCAILAVNMTFFWFGPELSIEKVLPAILIWAALLWWIGKRYGIDSMPIHPSTFWTQVTISEWLTIALLMAGAYGIAVLGGVSMDRRGESLEFKKGKEWLGKDILIGFQGGDRPFYSTQPLPSSGLRARERPFVASGQRFDSIPHINSMYLRFVGWSGDGISYPWNRVFTLFYVLSLSGS